MTEQLETELAAPSTGKIAASRDFLLSARAEMDKVSWPPKPELIKATRAVIIGSLLLGVVIGVLDWILQKILVDGVALLAR